MARKNTIEVDSPAQYLKSMLEQKDVDIGYTIIWMRKALIFLLEREIEIDKAVQEAAEFREEQAEK